MKAAVATLQARLADAETAAERHAREVKEAWDARMSAEERARLAEEERAVYEALAIEAEQRVAAAAPTAEQRMDFIVAAANAARNFVLDEADTRLLIDDQLRQAGWQADTLALRHGAGSRPEKGRAMAIAEWPTASGPADYALFLGEELVGLVEAKRKRRDVATALDQAERYSRGADLGDGGQPAGGPLGDFVAPFVFATNGRPFYPQFATQSGIWFRDVRQPGNGARALEGWPTPARLAERLQVDKDAAEAVLRARDFEFGFSLRTVSGRRDPRRRSVAGRRAARDAGGHGDGDRQDQALDRDDLSPARGEALPEGVFRRRPQRPR